MRQVKDIEQVLSTIGAVLMAREISFLAYSINLVEEPEGELPIQVYIHDPEGWQLLAALERDQARARIILDAWKSKKVLHRPDLARENIYGEHLPPQPQHDPVRCAIDVPFSRGTLALASGQPCAFSGEDISFLQEVAQVLEEGFQRLRDFEILHQAEQWLRTELGMQRMRNQILQMKSAEDWEKVVVCFWAELKELVEFNLSRIDLVQIRNLVAAATGPHRKVLVHHAHQLGQLVQLYQKLQGEQTLLESRIRTTVNGAAIKVQGAAYWGVTIRIGEYQRKLREDVKNPRFHIFEGRLVER